MGMQSKPSTDVRWIQPQPLEYFPTPSALLAVWTELNSLSLSTAQEHVSEQHKSNWTGSNQGSNQGCLSP